MNPLEMEDFIKRICKNNNINCRVKIEWKPIIAGYNYSDNTIYFNPDRCSSMASKMDMDITDFMKFTTLHEIGHYLDFKSEPSNSKLEREIMAWKRTRGFVHESELKAYDEFNKINIESYKKKHNVQ